jgi:DNA-binding MarR family transcriptional regulator
VATLFLEQLSDLLSPHGLTPSQFNVLRILRGAGADGLSCAEISKRMITKDSDITRLLDRLEKQKLIRRERLDSDRRVVVTWISDLGLVLLNSLDQPVRALHRNQFIKIRDLDKFATELTSLE